MNNEPSAVPAYITSLLRTGVGLVGGWLIGKGYITAEQAPELAGAVLTIFVAAWGIVSHARANSALKAAIAAPAGKAKSQHFNLERN